MVVAYPRVVPSIFVLCWAGISRSLLCRLEATTSGTRHFLIFSEPCMLPEHSATKALHGGCATASACLRVRRTAASHSRAVACFFLFRYTTRIFGPRDAPLCNQTTLHLCCLQTITPRNSQAAQLAPPAPPVLASHWINTFQSVSSSSLPTLTWISMLPPATMRKPRLHTHGPDSRRRCG